MNVHGTWYKSYKLKIKNIFVKNLNKPMDHSSFFFLINKITFYATSSGFAENHVTECEDL